jgi:hypothetical protein
VVDAHQFKILQDLAMQLFLDTEYTGLGQARPQLISLALVPEDGRREFYVELTDTWRLDDCTEFGDGRSLAPGLPGIAPRLRKI